MTQQHQHREDRTPTQRRFVAIEQLICPGCEQQVRPEPPGYWHVADGLPAPPVLPHGRFGALPARRRDGSRPDRGHAIWNFSMACRGDANNL